MHWSHVPFPLQRGGASRAARHSVLNLAKGRSAMRVMIDLVQCAAWAWLISD